MTAWATPGTFDGASGSVEMRRQLRHALIAVAILVFIIGGAAAIIPMGSAIVGSGQVGVESRVKRIAHPVGGTIAAILVKNGDRVKKGDPLIRFDDAVTGTDAMLSTRSVEQLLAQRARLEAEQLGNGAVRFDGVPAATGGAATAMANERKQFAIRQAETQGLRAQLRARIGQHQQQISGYAAQIAAAQRQLSLIEPERAGVRTLYDKGLVTIARFNQLERTKVDLEGTIGALRAQIAEAGARISETREQIIQLGQSRRSEAGTQLASVNAALNQQQVRSVSAGDIQGRSVIRAPYSGTVDKLAFAAIGDVVKPAETIMELVPDADRLIVEAGINPTDIDQVQVGQRARIRFSAFNTANTPEIAGRVVMVAPDSTVDAETRSSYYAIRVAIDPTALARARSIRLVPGMPGEVFVETGRRSMLSYITKPLRDQIARSFNDG